jgi:hypothetical protein
MSAKAFLCWEESTWVLETRTLMLELPAAIPVQIALKMRQVDIWCMRSVEVETQGRAVGRTRNANAFGSFNYKCPFLAL